MSPPVSTVSSVVCIFLKQTILNVGMPLILWHGIASFKSFSSTFPFGVSGKSCLFELLTSLLKNIVFFNGFPLYIELCSRRLCVH